MYMYGCIFECVVSVLHCQQPLQCPFQADLPQPAGDSQPGSHATAGATGPRSGCKSYHGPKYT